MGVEHEAELAEIAGTLRSLPIRQATVKAMIATGIGHFGRVIMVIDLNNGGTSVTNDAEAVVAHVAAKYGLDGRRILYRDTAGLWDELAHASGAFAGFRPLRETTLDRAVGKLGELGPPISPFPSAR
jgi:hypothetical protein